jgi:hypothetical protein
MVGFLLSSDRAHGLAMSHRSKASAARAAASGVQSQEADVLDGESVADLESLSRVRHRLLLTAELFDDALPDRLANDER